MFSVCINLAVEASPKIVQVHAVSADDARERALKSLLPEELFWVDNVQVYELPLIKLRKLN